MSVEIVPFEPAHCWGAKAHPLHARDQRMLDDPSIFRSIWPETLSAIDGGLIGIGGTVVIDGAVGCWLLFTDKINSARFGVIHRAVARILENHEIFAHVDPDMPGAMRWAKLLGLRPKKFEIVDSCRVFGVENHA